MPLEAIVPAPYSQDLRQRVIGFMALGGSARAAATRFDVSVSSAIRWAQPSTAGLGQNCSSSAGAGNGRFGRNRTAVRMKAELLYLVIQCTAGVAGKIA